MCISCRKLIQQSELIRVMLANETNKLHIQPSSRLHGRSAYVCFNKSCLQVCLKKAKLEKALNKKLQPEITEMLQKIAK